MPKKQSKARGKRLQRLKILRDKRLLLEKRDKLNMKNTRLNDKIRNESQKIRKLKRKTGARKYFNLTNLIKSAKTTANTLK